MSGIIKSEQEDMRAKAAAAGRWRDGVEDATVVVVRERGGGKGGGGGSGKGRFKNFLAALALLLMVFGMGFATSKAMEGEKVGEGFIGIRDRCIEINQRLKKLCSMHKVDDCAMINVGSKPYDKTVDSLYIAFLKVDDDLSKIIDKLSEEREWKNPTWFTSPTTATWFPRPTTTPSSRSARG